MKNQFIAFVALLLVFPLLSAQTGYKKKVVSYVNTVVSSRSYGLTETQKSHITSALSKSVQLDRFNYAPLPDNLIERFSAEISSTTSLGGDKIRSVIEKTLAPELLSILDLNKELLSKKNLSESERNTFLATKAQSAGLSAGQLEAILNSGFFYVPYVEQYKRSTSRGERDVKNKDGKVVRKQKYTTYGHEMKIGLMWFKLSVDRTNNPSIYFVGSAKGWRESGISSSEDQDDGVNGNADWDAFTSAVNTSAINIGNETKKMEEFKLSGGITEVTTFGVHLNLGRREGVGLDDSYWVEELLETESGDIIKDRRGFIKIRNVGNNKDDESAFSYAQTITGSNYSPGLSVTEIPMIGINALFGLGSIPVNIKPFDNRSSKFSLSDYNFAVNVTGETKSAVGPFVWFQGNIANTANVSELWVNAGAAIGFFSVDGKFHLPKYNSTGTQTGIDSTTDIGASMSGYANFGLVKKFYFRRFGLVLQADVKYWLTYLSATGKDKNDNDLTYSLTHDAIGLDGKIGLEMYITPMLSVGGGAEYNVFPASNSWTANVNDKDNNDTKNNDAVGPDTKYSGLSFYFWINYALPSLF